MISGAGAAAIGIFSPKASDPVAVRAATYGAVGLIVAAALIAAGAPEDRLDLAPNSAATLYAQGGHWLRL